MAAPPPSPLYYPWKMSIPENFLICGSSGSGKSTFLEKLLATPKIWSAGRPDKVLYCYGIYTANVENFAKNRPDISLIQGVPRNLSQPMEMFSPSQNNILIFDDLSSETQNNRDFTNMLIRGSRHCNCTLISLEHFLLSDSKERRLQSPHWHEVCLFKNQRCSHQIAALARQSDIADPKLVQKAYSEATAPAHGYLILDFRNKTPPELRLISNVFSENNCPPVVWV